MGRSMTAIELISELEAAYDKKLTPRQVKAYAYQMHPFSAVHLDSIYDWLLKQCRLMPRISDVYSAAKDLGLLAHTHRESRAKDNCRDCNGTGWNVVHSYHGETGEPYESVKRCSCTGQGMPDRGDGKGPGGWIFDSPSGISSGTKPMQPLQQLVEGEVPF